MSTQPTYNDLHKSLFEEGLKVRREVVGDGYVDEALENGSSEFAFPGQQLVCTSTPENRYRSNH
jgi:4-carboxymuconolactone decarboxylase